jgi:hypothetical protein
MWFILIRAALTGIFGSAFGKWFLATRMGRWFQTKLDTFMEYLAVKYDINIAKKEIAWAQQYPNLANRIEVLEAKIQELENAKTTTTTKPKAKQRKPSQR